MKKFLGCIIVITLCIIGGKFVLSFVGNENVEANKIGHTKEELKGNLVLVNKQNPIKKDYNLDDLRKVNINFIKTSTDEEKMLKDEAATALENLFEAAKRDSIILYGNSGYRSVETQKKIYSKMEKNRGKEYAKQYVAREDESEHLTGLAIDITNKERNFYEESREAKWVKKNAHKYGFILRYPKGKEEITGYSFEPWHIRYVGTGVSKIVYNKGITLEEYLQEE